MDDPAPTTALTKEVLNTGSHRLCNYFEALLNLVIVIRQSTQQADESATPSQPNTLMSFAKTFFENEPEVVKDKVKEMIEDASQKADQAGYPPSQIEDAKFALVAFFDEAIAFSTWDGKNKWATSKLQFEFFKRLDAGKEFFERLNILLETPHQNKDVIEIYYLCLGIGFKGENYDQPDRLETIKSQAYRKLQPLTDYADMSLSVQKATSNRSFEAIREVPSWLIYGIAAAIILLTWVIASRLA